MLQQISWEGISMHELNIIQNIFALLKVIAEKNQLKSITRVHLKIGKLRQVVPDFLEFAFATTVRGTFAEGAQLIIEYVPVKIHCNACKNDSVLEENYYLCPKCDSADISVLNGMEVILDSVEGDQ